MLNPLLLISDDRVALDYLDLWENLEEVLADDACRINHGLAPVALERALELT